jgi:hypothetical protein
VLSVVEVDETGRLKRALAFDAADRADAIDEAFNLFVGGEAAEFADALAPSRALGRALAANDWDALRRVLATDSLVVDNRRLGVLGGAETANDWIESQRAMVALAPDTSSYLKRIVAWDHRGMVAISRMHGTRDGGEFEKFFVHVHIHRDGLLARTELFALEDLDFARAGFDELRPDGGGPDGRRPD